MFKWFRKQNPKPDDFTARLQSNVATVRRQALDEATFREDVKLPENLLVQLLQDKEVDVRERALEYCQWHRPAGHTDYLVAALSDDSLHIRWKAVRHLSSFPTPKAAEPLRQLFKNDDEKLNGMVIMALGKCDDGQTAPFLFNLFTEIPLNPHAYSAGTQLGTLKAAAYVEPLIQFLTSDDEKRVDSAIWALGDIGDHRATEPLLKLLAKNPENGQLLHTIFIALAKIDDPAMVETLLPFVNDERFYIQQGAMGTLAQFQDDRITEAILPYLTSENPDLRATSVNALAKIGGKPVTDKVLEVFERESHPRILVVFVRALARLGDRRAIPLLEKRRATDDDRLIQEIDAALATLKSL